MKISTKVKKYQKKINEKCLLNLVSITFIIQIFLSFKLWISTRLFPTIPLIRYLKLSAPFDFILIGGFIVLLISSIICEKKEIKIGILVFLLILIFLDINRLQPWTYLYLIIYGFVAVRDQIKSNLSLKVVFQIIVIGAFFWSGISKLNYYFLEVTYISILEKVFEIKDFSFFIEYLELGFIIGGLEIFVSLLLIGNRTRKKGVILAVLAHVFIIFYVSPFGINNDMIVIPWNVLMIVIVIFSFYKEGQLSWLKNIGRKRQILNLSLITLILVLPVFNLIEKWDNFLSFNLYSDKIKNLIIIIEDKELPKLDKPLLDEFEKLSGVEGGKILNIGKWGFIDMNVPFYPEDWVRKEICSYFCSMNILEESLYFIEYKGLLKLENMITFSCEDLRK